jgi:hypothetical protein
MNGWAPHLRTYKNCGACPFWAGYTRIDGGETSWDPRGDFVLRTLFTIKTSRHNRPRHTATARNIGSAKLNWINSNRRNAKWIALTQPGSPLGIVNQPFADDRGGRLPLSRRRRLRVVESRRFEVDEFDLSRKVVQSLTLEQLSEPLVFGPPRQEVLHFVVFLSVDDSHRLYLQNRWVVNESRKDHPCTWFANFGADLRPKFAQTGQP